MDPLGYKNSLKRNPSKEKAGELRQRRQCQVKLMFLSGFRVLFVFCCWLRLVHVRVLEGLALGP